MINNFPQLLAVRKINLTALLLLSFALLGIGLIAFNHPAAAAGQVTVTANPANPNATTLEAKCNKGGFFGLESWYHYLPNSEIGIDAVKDKNGNVVIPADPCGVKCFNIFVQSKPNDCGEKNSDVPAILLAIIDDLLRIVGIVAVAFVLVGAFQYVGSRGNADRTAQAQRTIAGALSGVVIAAVAVAFVSFIGRNLN